MNATGDWDRDALMQYKPRKYCELKPLQHFPIALCSRALHFMSHPSCNERKKEKWTTVMVVSHLTPLVFSFEEQNCKRYWN